MVRGFNSPGEFSHRQLRAAEVVRSALVEIFAKGKFFDSFLFDVSITISQVRLSPDLKNATIYIWPFADIDENRVINSLNDIKDVLAREVAAKVKFKSSPKLFFRLDKNFDHAEKIEKMLKEKEQNF